MTRDERIAALTREGHSAPQIARLVGVCVRTVQRARVRTGVAEPFSGIPLSDDELRRAAAMLDDGVSYAEVARTLGRCPDVIRRRLPGRSAWTQGSGIEYRKYMAALDAIVPPINWEVAS